MHKAESALVFIVPEAEASTAPIRANYDPVAALGVPAHITALYPFMAPDEIGSEVLANLTAVFAAFAPFDFALARTGRFPGVLYLAPEPDGPFIALTQAIWRHYPDYPPYGGAHAGITPHLTLALLQDEAVLDAIEKQFNQTASGQSPVKARATEMALLENSTGRWRVHAKFAFGGG